MLPLIVRVRTQVVAWYLLSSVVVCAMFNGVAFADEARSIRDLAYNDSIQREVPLALDLFLPKPMPSAAPCVVFIHGGGWKGGSKKSGEKIASWLTEHGFAVASIDYRLTDEAGWPAQINDCYEAVRWVRRNAKKYHLDAEHIGVWGTSAGAHLAALVGTRNCPEQEDVSSQVQAVCDWFGPSELLTMPPNVVGAGRTEKDVAESNGAKLLRATVKDVPDLARDASAIEHVSSDDAPFLITHGDEDPGVPLAQSSSLHSRLRLAGVASRLRVVAGAGHGGKEFSSPANQKIVLQFFQRTLMENWNQGAGANGTFRTSGGTAVTTWSAARNENIRWRKQLPETGQSAVVTWGERLFFTTMEQVDGDSELGSDIIAWCCDVKTGETLWTRKIAGKYPLQLSGCFSDSSSPSPVTDGETVCFFNASGTIAAYDFNGEMRWTRDIMPAGRSQPVLVDDKVVFIRQSYMPDAGGHFTHEHLNAPRDQWTQLQAIDLRTGTEAWKSECGVNMGCVPLIQDRTDGRRVFVVGRGGGHSPPEKPDGISMVDAENGSTLWTLPLEDFMSTMTFQLYGDDVLVFHRDHHLWVDAMTGKVRREISIMNQVSVRSHVDGQWENRTESIESDNVQRAIIQQSNLLVGKYHYYRSYTMPWIGRVNCENGAVEYLQLPVQINPGEGSSSDQLLWDSSGMNAQIVEQLLSSGRKRLKNLPITQWAFTPNDMQNSRGFQVMGDARSQGNGWGHHASQVPTVSGDNLYVPTMAGTVYVIGWNAKTLNEDAIVAINDLGMPGKSWNRASLTVSGGRIYAHTIGEVLCIGD